MSSEQNENLDGRDDAGLAQAAARRSSGIAREQDAAELGHTPSSGSSSEPVQQGTAAGNPVAGREINHSEAVQAVERSPEV
jgi:hypothetical protein